MTILPSRDIRMLKMLVLEFERWVKYLILFSDMEAMSESVSLYVPPA